MTLRIGPLAVDPPVVLAPMAGVTDAPFRGVCSRFGAGLYVSEMITARALVERNARTLVDAPLRRLRGHPLGAALRHRPPHARRGGALPRRRGRRRPRRHELRLPGPQGHPQGRRLRAPGAPRAAARHRPRRGARPRVRSRSPSSSAWASTTTILTYLDTGRIAEEEGVAAIALHARTAEQLYSGSARWDAIAALKAARHARSRCSATATSGRPHDALAMLAQTGLRRRGGRPRLPRSPVAVPRPRRRLRRPPGAAAAPPRWVVAEVMRDHAERLVEWSGEVGGMKSFRKHAGWYLTGYPVGGEAAEAGQRSWRTLADLDALHRPARPRRPRSRERAPGRPRPHQRPAAGRTSPTAGSTRSTTPPHPRAPSSSCQAADRAVR